MQAATKMYAPKSIKRIIHYRTYKTFHESHFLDELQHTPFQVAKIFDDPDDQFGFNNKIILEECDNVIANNKDVSNVFNEYFINTTNDMSELDHIDKEGQLNDILSAYQNHPSINEIK